MSERLRSGAKGLSLTQGVVRYQFPRPDDDQMLGSSALVQRFCNLAVGFESPFRFRFNSDEHSFEIVWAAALADDDESLGLFFIGDDGPSMFDLSERGPLVEDVRTKMQTLHRLLEGSLHAPWNAQHLVIYGRVGHPLASPTIIPADALRQFAVSDWDKGIVAAGKAIIHSLRLDLAKYPQRGDVPANELAKADPFRARKKSKGGRLKEYDWNRIRHFAFSEMKSHGAPTSDDPEFRTQTELVKRCLGFCEINFGRQPAFSTMHAYTAPWIEEYRQGVRD